MSCGRGISAGERSRRAAKSRPRRPCGLFERVRGLLGWVSARCATTSRTRSRSAEADADFTPQERAILKNVLALHDVRVADVMVPRADIIALAADTPLSEVLALFRTAGHSRLPVFGETLDDPQGMIHIRDFVDFLASEPNFGLAPEGSRARVRATVRRRGRHGHAARGGIDSAPGALCAALDAGARSAAEDADLAHPYGAGHRRIWRHRRSGLDRGRRRGDRGRYRG